MSKSVMAEGLRAIPLFAELSAAELDVLTSSARSVVFRKGARIFEEGSDADCCFVLMAGTAHVVLESDRGRQIQIGTVVPRRLVGEIALLDRCPRSASVVAAETCQMIRIPQSAFDALRRNPSFERRLVVHLAVTLRDANDRLRAMLTFSSTARVAWCLVRIAREEGRWDADTLVVPRKPHQELADMSGCSRETVSRALAALKRRKCLSWDGSTIRLQVEGLQRAVRAELPLPPHTNQT